MVEHDSDPESWLPSMDMEESLEYFLGDDYRAAAGPCLKRPDRSMRCGSLRPSRRFLTTSTPGGGSNKTLGKPGQAASLPSDA